jgi:hypothetical protein
MAFAVFGFSGEFFHKWKDILFTLSLKSMEYSACGKISKESHIIVALFDTEFINSDIFYFMKRDLPIKALKFDLWISLTKSQPTSRKWATA